MKHICVTCGRTYECDALRCNGPEEYGECWRCRLMGAPKPSK